MWWHIDVEGDDIEGLDLPDPIELRRHQQHPGLFITTCVGKPVECGVGEQSTPTIGELLNDRELALTVGIIHEGKVQGRRNEDLFAHRVFQTSAQ